MLVGPETNEVTNDQTPNAAVSKALKRLHYPLDVKLTCVRWYVAYPLSLRHLEEMMSERAVSVDHSTVHWWESQVRARSVCCTTLSTPLPRSSQISDRLNKDARLSLRERGGVSRNRSISTKGSPRFVTSIRSAKISIIGPAPPTEKS
jgi:hypothetical protein